MSILLKHEAQQRISHHRHGCDERIVTLSDGKKYRWVKLWVTVMHDPSRRPQAGGPRIAPLTTMIGPCMEFPPDRDENVIVDEFFYLEE